MLLFNPNYSCIYSYTKLVNNLFKDNKFDVKYKCYDKQENNIISFNCFDIESLIKTKENLILKELKYEGCLKFEYDKVTNQVFISSVPKIKYMNTEVPVFTSDIAKIIVDKLNKYIPSSDIKLSFFNPLSIMAEDDNIIKSIPSIRNCKNHTLFKNIYKKIEEEEKEIITSTNKYKQKQAKLERSKEISLAKKRKILNIDPNEFDDIKDFEKQLSDKLLVLWNGKIENIKRHLNLNESKYKEIMLNKIINYNDKDNINDLEYLLRQYLLELCSFNKVISIKDYSKKYPLSKDDYDFLKYNINYKYLDSKTKKLLEVWKYFYEYKPLKDQINLDKAKIAVDFLLDFDLNSKTGVIKCFNYLTGYNDIRYKTPLEHFRKILKDKKIKLTGFEIYQLFLRYDTEDLEFRHGYKHSKYHPLFKETYNKYENIKFKNNDDFYRNCLDMKKQNLHLYSLDLIVQIDRLKEQLSYYESLINNPNEVVLNFYKDSRCWGSLIQIPYWKRLYCDQNEKNKTYNLVMIKPGIKKIETSFDDFIRFVDAKNIFGSRVKNKIIKRELINKTWNFKATTYSIIMIPDSLNDEQTKQLVEYAFLGGTSNIFFICESFEKEKIVKDAIVTEFLNWYQDVGDFFQFCDVIVDPTYYESFLIDTPNNKNLWEKYEYNSDYKYSRKEILGFESKIQTALEHSICGYYMPPDFFRGIYEIDNWMFDELLFGGYSKEPVFKEEYESFLNDISEKEKSKAYYLSKKQKEKTT